MPMQCYAVSRQICVGSCLKGFKVYYELLADHSKLQPENKWQLIEANELPLMSI